MTGVYLIYRNGLFRDALGAILGAHPAIRLLGATDQPLQARSDIAHLVPDVILLEEVEDDGTESDIRTIVASPMPVRLITLRLDQDGMHVWSQVWQKNAGPQDLVGAILAPREDTR
jgi:chemotaxis response regulator CheB